MDVTLNLAQIVAARRKQTSRLENTTHRTDRILVLEHGRVIEEGSHAELLRAGARYARLFHMQAQGYR